MWCYQPLPVFAGTAGKPAVPRDLSPESVSWITNVVHQKARLSEGSGWRCQGHRSVPGISTVAHQRGACPKF